MTIEASPEGMHATARVEDAADCLGFERTGGYSARAARMATRDMLADRARALGYPDREIERVVDAALAAAALQ